MDLTSVKMKQGEGQWQDKFNRLVDAVQKVGGVTDQLQWITSSDGVVFLNGWNGEVKYEYVQIGDKKLVSVQGAIKGNAKATQYTELLTIPDNIKPKNRMLQYQYWDSIVQIVDNKIGVRSGGDIKESTDSTWNLVFEFNYVC